MKTKTKKNYEIDIGYEREAACEKNVEEMPIVQPVTEVDFCGQVNLKRGWQTREDVQSLHSGLDICDIHYVTPRTVPRSDNLDVHTKSKAIQGKKKYPSDVRVGHLQDLQREGFEST